MKKKVLIVDDEPSIIFGYTQYLKRCGYDVASAETLDQASSILISQPFDAMLLDMNLPDGSGLDWLPKIRPDHNDLAIIVITGEGGIPDAVEAIKKGADNFLTKPVKMNELEVILNKCLEIGTLRRASITNERLSKKSAGPFVGTSALMARAMELAELSASSDTVVLITGDTGTGKGVVARWIHEHGSNSNAPFVEVNCSGLRGEMLASELFGHARGAFTSAVADRKGLIEVAHGGTIFLDEIGDMSPEVQAHLLKVIEDKTFRRLGETNVRRSDFRLICATNRDLQKATADGSFRSDLYYRINIMPIAMPSLRARIEDVPAFARHFAREISGRDIDFPTAIDDLLTAYTWPGNARELRNVIERALLLSKGGPLNASHFPGLADQPAHTDEHNLEHMEALHIKSVLDECGDIKKASEKLGISRSTLYRKIKKLT